MGKHSYLIPQLCYFVTIFQSKIASCTSSTNNWNSGSVQASERIPLEANKPYYLEAYSDADHVTVRVRLDQTEHTNTKVGAAVDEKQQITISSTIDWEKQVRFLWLFNISLHSCNEFISELLGIRMSTVFTGILYIYDDFFSFFFVSIIN